MTERSADDQVTGGLTQLGDVRGYRIDGLEHLEPFLTTVVSDTDLWMFISSTGALTAGRIDADHAIFPYLTDDRIHRSVGTIGPVTVIARTSGGVRELWRPFEAECPVECSRSISKSVLGDTLVMEERHRDWDLTFRTTWSPSASYGWVREVEVVNHGPVEAQLEVLDGLLDVMPAGVGQMAEQSRSNLVDAYKRSETGPWGTAAIYTLESLVTDRAEPGEALAATIVWSSGFPSPTPLLDERAVHDVLTGAAPRRTTLLTGRQGAYLLEGRVEVAAGRAVGWTVVADTGLDHATVVDRLQDVGNPEIASRLAADIEAGRRRLHSLLDGADAFQESADAIADAHHLSNVLFNSMRGGVFPHGYLIPVHDLIDFLGVRNRPCAERHLDELEALGDSTSLAELETWASESGDPDLQRLVLEYLPLTFSRRHGDPSRPWNAFSIRVKDETGGEVLAYEGNWRDIFQNWEALLQSYPAYLPHVVAKFVNASTADGYNPYRISRDGIDWEVPDPDDPWSNIGYWGDHQVVYLLRLLEAWERFAPGELAEWADRQVFVYADVPYTVADHEAMVRDTHDTITYDVERAAEISIRERRIGTDGRLLTTTQGELVRAGLFEKLLVPALGKLSAFVPGGGIWMNTQRPEWNDANNALAGNGLSVVTLGHLVRYLGFIRDLASRLGGDTVQVSAVVDRWFRELGDVLGGCDPVEPADERGRRELVDALGSIGSAHRARLAAGLVDEQVELRTVDVERFCTAALIHLEHTLRGARRPDGLFHSYNRISFPSESEAVVDHLDPMLEGQVSILSSGMLDGRGAIDVVWALFASDMYRADQDSFMLYPVVAHPGFLDRNNVSPAQVARARFLSSPLDDRWRAVFVEDRHGTLHFRPSFPHAAALRSVLDEIGAAPDESEVVEDIYEELFGHDSFTGRSGAMYGYEGIGSIYWHMVAKLLLTVQENHAAASDRHEPADVVEGLAAAYRRIRDGLGFRKSPEVYGAFPIDCYSHTPTGAGAKQPGMTGQVKEEILARFGETGLRIRAGTLRLEAALVDPAELFGADLAGTVSLSLGQTPIGIAVGDAATVRTTWEDGRVELSDGNELAAAVAAEIFARSGAVERVDFTIDREHVPPRPH